MGGGTLISIVMLSLFTESGVGQYWIDRTRSALLGRRRHYSGYSGNRGTIACPVSSGVCLCGGVFQTCVCSPTLIRTCFFVLGLISSTPQGAEILDDYRWEATLSPLGLPTGLCIPLDVDKFVSVSFVISKRDKHSDVFP